MRGWSFSWLKSSEPTADFFLPVKNNLSAEAAGLGYHLLQRPVTNDIIASYVEWDHEPVSLTANDAVRATASATSKLSEAKDLLLEELANGPVAAETLIAQGERREISERTLRAAKNNSDQRQESSYQGESMWQLLTE